MHLRTLTGIYRSTYNKIETLASGQNFRLDLLFSFHYKTVVYFDHETTFLALENLVRETPPPPKKTLNMY